MYDFYFGTKEEIAKNETKFLISIKRMLPKWCNSIPDSEYIALFKIGDDNLKNREKPIIVETGCGASTIVLAYLAMKYNGILYTWDLNGEKGSELRRIMVETLCNYFDKNINKYWKFIAYNSTSKPLGIPIIGELEHCVDMSFHDSRHVWTNLEKEIELVSKYYVDGSILAIDDGNYYDNYEDIAYINVFRKKLGLSQLESPVNNIGEQFYERINRYLRNRWSKVTHFDDYYKKHYKNDLFFKYYESEIDVRTKLNMEKVKNLPHRFDSWIVSGKK